MFKENKAVRCSLGLEETGWRRIIRHAEVMSCFLSGPWEMARGSQLLHLTVPMLSWPRRLGSNGGKRLGREARLPHSQQTLHDLMKQEEQADITFMTKRSKVGQSRQDSGHEGPLSVIADTVQRAEQTHKDGAGGNWIFYRS